MRTAWHFTQTVRDTTVALMLTALTLLLLCTPGQSRADHSPGGDYRIGARITSFVGTSPRDAEIAMKLIIEELLNDPVQKGLWDKDGLRFDFFRTRDEFIEAQASGDFDLLVGSTIDLIDTIDELEHDNFYTFDIGGHTKSRYILLTNVSSKFDSLESLSDARIIAPKGAEIGILWMENLLQTARVTPPQEHARTYTPTEDYVDGINKVYFDQGDVALATREALEVAVELNPQLMDSLKILGESEPLLTTVAVPTVLPTKEQKFDEMIRSVHERKAGMSVLRLFRCNRILRGDPKELDSIRRLTAANGSAT